MTFQKVTTLKHTTPTRLPERQTKHSAGYDFYLKENILLMPGETKLTFTDVKCELAPYEVLYIHIRSSIGMKQKVMLGNGTGVIDADYYENPDNDGNIGVCLHNYGDRVITLEAGERVAQGVIHTFNARETVHGLRSGGLGSTSR